MALRCRGAGGGASGSSRSSAPSAAWELLLRRLGSQRQVSFNGLSSLLKELVLDSPELPADAGGLRHLLLVPSCQLIPLPYLQRSACL